MADVEAAPSAHGAEPATMQETDAPDFKASESAAGHLSAELQAAEELNQQLKAMVASQALSHRPDTSQQFRTHEGKLQPRTFTSKPRGRARQFDKPDYTHNEARLVAIANETRSLVNRLQKIYNRPVKSTIAASKPPRDKPCNESPYARNRRAFQSKVELENLRIYHRLQAVKPSKDLSLSTQKDEYRKARYYAKNCSRFHVGKPPKGQAQKPRVAEAVQVPTAAAQHEDAQGPAAPEESPPAEEQAPVEAAPEADDAAA